VDEHDAGFAVGAKDGQLFAIERVIAAADALGGEISDLHR